MRPEEIAAVGDLAGEAAAGTALQIHQIHAGIAQRVWSLVGPAALPVRVVHDQVARGAYLAAGKIARAAVRTGAFALSAARSPDAPSIEQSASGRAVIGALNGVFGDTLARRRNRLALAMTLRRGGRDVAISPEALRAEFPQATSRLAVFVHGLWQTEEAWMRGGAQHVPYGFRLQAELGFTPLYVRYNSGLHLSDNGRRLAELLDAVVTTWPVPVHEIALLGHSMGGLVAHSACYHGAGSEWASRVRRVFTLGTPHRGFPLERLANRASAALALLPETRALANALDVRSGGMKDLRHGYVVEEGEHDVAGGIPPRRIPFLRTAEHYFISATLSREPDDAVGRIVGDILVLHHSAWAHDGPGEPMRFPVANYRQIGGVNHFQLLNHPVVYEQLRRWMMSRRALPAPAA
jgi:pimeloyl-ACP methyl ester carboxylesterase